MADTGCIAFPEAFAVQKDGYGLTAGVDNGRVCIALGFRSSGHAILLTPDEAREFARAVALLAAGL